MKRLVPVALAALLALCTARVPAATAAAALSSQQSDELVGSYVHLTADFYKKVDRQAALDGARTSIIDYLKKHNVNATLPVIRATDSEETNVEALHHEVSTAVSDYASKLQPVEAISPSTQITYAAIAGVLGSVKDKYTVFLSPKEYAALNEGLDGTSFGGVGISYTIDDKTHLLHIENVILDGPSDKAGLQADDMITSIDGSSVPTLLAPADEAQKNNADKRAEAEQQIVTKLLRGNPGTRVRLGVRRSTKDIGTVTVTREEIHAPSVLAKMLPNDIGYVDLSVFGATTAQELSAALSRLDSKGAKAYVLDLRRNGGGYLNAAVDVSSKFIATGPIVSVQSRAGADTEYDAENTAIPPRPLAVLVDQYTASASEITAGAIQDSGVGTLVGTKTFGKGVVQTIFPMRDGSAIKITTARYFTPKGRDINSIGIQPDIESTLPKDLSGIKFRDPNSDPQLIAAIRFLDSKLALNGTPPAR
ncbi:MAG TPA: S41 family peptidase [Candidatus Elarobacter sp.]|jgi:carboxyl-terminal processing protease|nr:S41 family peptidase [Candidatus Elarobacter sp.]